MTAERYDVAVIGAGIVGVSTALHILTRGKKVVLIDRKGVGLETSYGNAGVIGDNYILPFAFPALRRLPGIALGGDTAARIHYRSIPRFLPWLAAFYRQSKREARLKNGKALRALVTVAVNEHRRLAHNGSERYLSPVGRAALYRSYASFQGDALERALAQEAGVPFEISDAESFRTIEPHIRPIYRKAVRWVSGHRITNPGRLVAAHAERFVAEGGILKIETAQSLEPEVSGWNIRTSAGAIGATHVVICAGPWANDLLEPLGYNFPLGFKRGYHRHYRAADGASLSHAIVDVDKGYLITPMEQGYRITTGVEFAMPDAPPTPIQLARVLPYARELFPLTEPVEQNIWMGSRPCFPDSLPVIGATTRHSSLWLNIGHGHIGMTIGPASGRLIAEMMTGEKTFCDPTPYRAERFG